MTKNYRKITVGDSFSSCIAYVKGANYLNRRVRITDIINSDTEEDSLDIYIKPNNDENAAKVLWKTVGKKSILETEYDLNFE
tara:strand:+ start:2082 stop:2327 length:246 start_codon:yes stop_codon:yes gene_type:complete